MIREAALSKKEPMLRISKRDSIPWKKAWGIRLLAVLLGLIICAVVIFLMTRLNPVEVYRSIIDGAVGTGRRSWTTIRDTMVLLCILISDKKGCPSGVIRLIVGFFPFQVGGIHGYAELLQFPDCPA